MIKYLAIFALAIFGCSIAPSPTASAEILPAHVAYPPSIHQQVTAQDLCFARWEWDTTSIKDLPHWAPPFRANQIGLLDVRTNAQQEDPGLGPAGWGFFAYDQPMGSTAMFCFGDDLDAPITGGSAGTLALVLGKELNDFAGRDMRGLFKEIFTEEATGDGDTFWKPARAGSDGHLKIWLEGFGLIVDEIVSEAHPGFQPAMDVRWADYRRNKAAGYPLELLQKWTGADAKKYFGTDTPNQSQLVRLLPPEHRRDGSRKPTTTVSDDFNRANENPLASPWTHDDGDADIVSNQVAIITNEAVTRNTTALSSDDHYAQISVINTPANWVGVMARKVSSTTLTYYGLLKQGSVSADAQRYYRAAGTYNFIAANSDSFTTTDIYEIRVEGTSIEYWKNDVFVAASTHGTLSGEFEHGFISNDATEILDDYLAEDLGGAPEPTGEVTQQIIVISWWEKLLEKFSL